MLRKKTRKREALARRAAHRVAVARVDLVDPADLADLAAPAALAAHADARAPVARAALVGPVAHVDHAGHAAPAAPVDPAALVGPADALVPVDLADHVALAALPPARLSRRVSASALHALLALPAPHAGPHISTCSSRCRSSSSNKWHRLPRRRRSHP